MVIPISSRWLMGPVLLISCFGVNPGSSLTCTCIDTGHGLSAFKHRFEESLDSIRASGVDIPICYGQKCSIRQFDILKEYGLVPMCLTASTKDSVFKHCSYTIEKPGCVRGGFNGVDVCHCDDQDFCNIDSRGRPNGTVTTQTGDQPTANSQHLQVDEKSVSQKVAPTIWMILATLSGLIISHW